MLRATLRKAHEDYDRLRQAEQSKLDARSRQWVVDGELSDHVREGSRLNEGSSSSHGLLVELSESDLVFGGKEHESTLTAALADAVSSVFLASAVPEQTCN